VHPNKNRQNKKDKTLIDYFLYALAGSVLAAMSFSFLLWLRF